MIQEERSELFFEPIYFDLDEEKRENIWKKIS